MGGAGETAAMGDPEKKERLQRYLGHLVGKKNNGRNLKMEKSGRKQERLTRV